MPRAKLFDEEKVLEKAMKVFWKKGYYATSMQDLVDGMGINRASLYDTFGSKEELFDRAFQRYRDFNQNRIRKFLHSQPSVKAGLLHLFEVAIDEALSDRESKGCFAVNATAEMVPADAAMSKALTDNRLNFQQLFHEYLQRGVDQGEITPDKDLSAVAALIFTLYNGIMVLSKINRNREELMAAVRIGLEVLD